MSPGSGNIHHFVRDALMPYSENVKIQSRGNPMALLLNGRACSIHASYVHGSGHTRSEEEMRIQIGRPMLNRQQEAEAKGTTVAFIGFVEDGSVFFSWDPRHILSLKTDTSVSVYARRSQFDQAKQNLAAVHEFEAKLLGKTSFAIALPSPALGLYLENVKRFHDLTTEASIVHLMRKQDSFLNSPATGQNGGLEVQDGKRRVKMECTRASYPRDPRFKRQVLEAYRHTCCVCSRQLAMVQSAHVVPHSEPDCPNTVQNGLALCVEHHRLYDDALLLPGPERVLVFNDDRAEYLKDIGKEKGLDDIKKLSKERYWTPDRKELQPSDDYLQRGLDIRMGA